MQIRFSAVPTFADPLTLEVKQAEDGSGVLFAQTSGAEKSEWEVSVRAQELGRLIVIATNLPPPPIPIERDEVDGTQYRLEIHSDDGETLYEWLDNIPGRFHQVGELVDELLRLAGPRAKLAGIW